VARQLARLDELPADLGGAQRGLVRLALVAAAAPLRRADRVELLEAGPGTFRALVEALDSAEHFAHLEFYIWRDDASGRAVRDVLVGLARRGVRVRVLCDHIGSFGLPRRHFAPLVEAGGEVAWFAPLHGAALRTLRANFRNHRKLISIDQRLGFVGGVNVADEYLGTADPERAWRDVMLRIEGDAVLGLETIFAADWLDACGPEAEPALWEQEMESAGRTRAQRASEGPLVQLIASGPDAPVTASISAQLGAAIAVAERRCWIATPYLVPDDALMLMLQTAAMRGVDVRLLVPARSDSRIVGWASASYYDGLLEAGCSIFEYPAMIHSKFMVVDDALAAIGSANMDVRSFHLNYEVTAMFYDAGVNADLARVFLRDAAQATPVRPESRADLSAWRTAAEAFGRVLSPLL
jgi:cardiolipin synthase